VNAVRFYLVLCIHFFAHPSFYPGISGDKIEIDPLSTKGLFKSKPKPVTIDIEDIAACLLTESKHQGEICSLALIRAVAKPLVCNVI